MRSVLGQLQNSGKLDVEEEFEQACFHISVYKTYAPQRAVPVQQLIAANDVPRPANVVPASSAAVAAPAEMTATPVHYRVDRSASHRRVHSATVYHATRHTVVRHRRRHHRSISLLAAGMR
jgi:hypothetical protein